MDVDFWASRVRSSKHVSARINVSGTYGDEGDDEARAWFPCPFCYLEIEIQMLCVHLQEEHCFDLKNAVCPICAANLGKNPVSHFSVQHVNLIKRKKSKKSGFSNNPSADIVKDLRELGTVLGNRSLSSSSQPAHDSILSPFICFEDDGKDISAASNDSLSDLPLAVPRNRVNYEEKLKRATFIQELLVSAIL